jgi:hypothetical protein
MSAYERPRRFDRATAEQLLQGGAAAGASQPRLAALLAAAAAPPVRAAKPRGEAAALAAFQAAHRDPVAQPRRLSMLRTSLAKLLTVKIGVVCAAVLGLGGVAVAATGGSLPGPLHFHAAPPSGSPSHRPKPSGLPTAWPTAWPSRAVPPGLLALCQRYAGDKDRDHRVRSLNDPRFGDLVRGAGLKDRDRVDRFCDFILHPRSGAPSGFPTTRPSTWPKPSGFPTTFPKPSGLPSRAPAPSRPAR